VLKTLKSPPKDSNLINTFGKRIKVNIEKSVAFLYTNKQSEEEIRKTITFSIIMFLPDKSSEETRDSFKISMTFFIELEKIYKIHMQP
jgi:hypothetical protein